MNTPNDSLQRTKQPPEALVKQLFEEVGELYALYVADRPRRGRARYIAVVDHDATPSTPGPRKPWLNRLAGKRNARHRHHRPSETPCKKVFCWNLSFIRRIGERQVHTFMFLDIETGQLYCDSFYDGHLTTMTFDVLGEAELRMRDDVEVSAIIQNIRNRKAEAEHTVLLQSWTPDPVEPHEWLMAASVSREKNGEA